MRIVGEDGRTLPRDGKAVGELQVRGHRSHCAYTSSAPTDRGWNRLNDNKEPTDACSVRGE
jgi:hypothetical protein